MFIDKSMQGINKLTNLSKMLVAIAAVITTIGGGVIFFEDRYFSTASAKEMKKSFEESSVKTFEMQQKILKTEQEGLSRKWDVEQLSDLRDHKLLLTKELSREPNNELLKERIGIIKQKIIKLENKLYGD